jgi:signal peptidase
VLFTHRVVEVVEVGGEGETDGERRFVTRGDANAAPDPAPVPAAWVVGRVELSMPLVGSVIALLGIPSGVAFLLSLGLTLLSMALLIETFEREPGTRRRRVRPFAPAGTALAPSAHVAGSVARSMGTGGSGVRAAHWRSVGRSGRSGRRSGWVVDRRLEPQTGTG